MELLQKAIDTARAWGRALLGVARTARSALPIGDDMLIGLALAAAAVAALSVLVALAL